MTHHKVNSKAVLVPGPIFMVMAIGWLKHVMKPVMASNRQRITNNAIFPNMKPELASTILVVEKNKMGVCSNTLFHSGTCCVLELVFNIYH